MKIICIEHRLLHLKKKTQHKTSTENREIGAVKGKRHREKNSLQCTLGLIRRLKMKNDLKWLND